MFTGIQYTDIFYALGGSEMPNGQNLRPIAAGFANSSEVPTLGCAQGGLSVPTPSAPHGEVTRTVFLWEASTGISRREWTAIAR